MVHVVDMLNVRPPEDELCSTPHNRNGRAFYVWSWCRQFGAWARKKVGHIRNRVFTLHRILSIPIEYSKSLSVWFDLLNSFLYASLMSLMRTTQRPTTPEPLLELDLPRSVQDVDGTPRSKA